MDGYILTDENHKILYSSTLDASEVIGTAFSESKRKEYVEKAHLSDGNRLVTVWQHKSVICGETTPFISLSASSADLTASPEKLNTTPTEQSTKSKTVVRDKVVSIDPNSSSAHLGNTTSDVESQIGKGIEMEFFNVNFNATSPIDGSKKQILNDCAGCARSGKLTVLMGPSGAGKTTLLNAIAGRIKVDDGSQMLFDGHARDRSIKRRTGFVLQEDILFSNLTVRETLLFTALLRLPYEMPHTEKIARVEEVISQLGLERVRNSIIGNFMMRGISGGERKRVNVGCELLAWPSILILDEPTSGLDSTTALELMKTLKQLARRNGTTIISSIHQPSSQIYSLFDDLILVGRGYVLYYGPANKATSHFHSLGFPVYEDFSAGDYLIEMVMHPKIANDDEVLKKLNRHAYDQTMFRPRNWKSLEGPAATTDGVKVEEVTTTVSEVPARVQHDGEDEAEAPKFNVPFWGQFKALSQRAFKQKRGQSMRWLFVVQVIAIALVVSALWFQIPSSESHIQDLTGAAFFIGVFFQFFNLFSCLSQFPSERAVLYKERAAGAYRLSAYFCAKTLSELPFDVLYPFMFTTITFWLCGLYINGAAYVEFFFTILLGALCAQSLGLFISAAILDFEKSIVFASIFILFQMLAGGFYVRNMPNWIEWISYISIIKYMYEAAIFIVFPDDRDFSCSSTSTIYRASNGGMCPIPGNAIRDALDIHGTIGSRIGALFAFMIGYRILAYYALRYRGKARF
eukprot:ANDGO_02077.mRNA.1 ABC transporter G family member 27